MGQYESITTHEKDEFKDMWDLVKQNLYAIGISLSKNLRVGHPHILCHFGDDEKLQRHSRHIMEAMDDLVSNLDSLQENRKYINHLGIIHARYTIPPEEFEGILHCIIKAITTEVGVLHFNEGLQQLYNKMISIAFNYLRTATDRARVDRLLNS